LSVANQALVEAGYTEKALDDESIGVFIGISNDEYLQYCEKRGISTAGRYANKAYAAANICKILDIRGFAKSFDTTDSSVAALDEACRALGSGQCSVAVVGGCSLLLTDKRFKELERDGRLNNEDNLDSAGLIPSEGAAVLILKSATKAKEDKDTVYIKIKKIVSNGDASSEIFPNKNLLLQLLSSAYNEQDVNKLKRHGSLGTGTKYCEDILKITHNTVLSNSVLSNLRSKEGDIQGASSLVAIIDTIYYSYNEKENNEIGDCRDRLYGITEVGNCGLNYHIVLSGPEDKVFELNRKTYFEIPGKTSVPLVPKAISQITFSAPFILGISNHNLPIDRMMKYWTNTKKDLVPLPLGKTFIMDSLFEDNFNGRMVHMLVNIPSTGKKLEAIIRGKGKPVVLIPGYGLTVTQFLPQLLTWNLKCQFICLHPPGVGLSEECDDYSFEAISNYYMEVLDILGVTEKINILSTSWGGVLAQFIARKYQSRCNSLILANTSSELIIDSHVGLKEMINSDFGNVNGEDALKMFDESTCITESSAYRYEAVLSSGRGRTESFMAEIKIPTLVIAGRKDTLIPVEAAENISRQIENSILEIVETSGHATNLTNPKEFNEICERFLTSNSVEKQNIIKQISNRKKLLKHMKEGE
jgi:pimeloyl-ACP methyl ester carboxylesterase